MDERLSLLSVVIMKKCGLMLMHDLMMVEETCDDVSVARWKVSIDDEPLQLMVCAYKGVFFLLRQLQNVWLRNLWDLA